tara:strand:- start:1212 stop:1553 length:342 start_codon:yes stop_codon:yes gene_type:complete
MNYKIFFLLFALLLPINCSNQDKWAPKPLKLKKQESYNYSEMISGKLDSNQKNQLEKYKTSVVKNELSDSMVSKQPTESISPIEKNIDRIQNVVKYIVKYLNYTYDWIKNLFN